MQRFILRRVAQSVLLLFVLALVIFALARVSGGRSFAEREIRRTLEAMLVGFGGSGRPARPKPARAR